MKMLIPTEGPNIKSRIAKRLGTAPFFLILDTETMDTEILRSPVDQTTKGSGMQAVVLAIEKRASIVAADYCSPIVEKYLKANGIRLLKGFRGTVDNVVNQLQREALAPRTIESQGTMEERRSFYAALFQASKQFSTIILLVVGVIGLIGLLNAFVPKRLLLSLFPGNKGLDTLTGACLGSIFAGNPINSYILGNALLERGVSLFGVTAFIVSWVSVGILQLPVEVSAMGKRFAIARNLLSFMMAICVAIFTVICLELLSGGGF